MMLYAKIAAIVISLGIAYWQGYSTMKDKHLLFVSEVESIAKAQEAANQHAIEVAEIISETVKNEYEIKIAGLRNRYANTSRVCDQGGRPNKLSKTSPTTSRADELAADSRLAGLCAETTQQLISLQQWISKQQEHQK
jgi:predicted transcriptional regulator